MNHGVVIGAKPVDELNVMVPMTPSFQQINLIGDPFGGSDWCAADWISGWFTWAGKDWTCEAIRGESAASVFDGE